MGPLLFTIYINPIELNLKQSSIHLYADDGILYPTAPSVSQAMQNIETDFQIVQQHFVNLKLLMNTNKTKSMLFSKKPSAPQKVSILTLDIHILASCFL